MDKYERERKRMVKEQIERRGLHDPRLLAAIRICTAPPVCPGRISLCSL